jgi:hypothetical protein
VGGVARDGGQHVAALRKEGRRGVVRAHHGDQLLEPTRARLCGGNEWDTLSYGKTGPLFDF